MLILIYKIISHIKKLSEIMIFLLTNEDKILFEGMRKEFHARMCMFASWR